MSQILSLSQSFLTLLKNFRGSATKLVRDREHASAMATLATFSATTAISLHLQAEAAQENSVSQGELEVGMKDKSRALVMTVDHNNFLPCLSVSQSVNGCSRIDYRPV